LTNHISKKSKLNIPILTTFSRFKIIKVCTSEEYATELNKILSTIDKADRSIKYPCDYKSILSTYFKKTPGEEGLELIHQETIANQRGAFGYVLSQIGKNLMKGRFSLAYSLPINVFDCRTTMEFFAWNLQLMNGRLEAAKKTPDTMTRLKQLTIFLCTMSRINIPVLNPLMPTLGETFQCNIGDVKCYFETTTQNPPIFNFYFIGKEIRSYGHWYLAQEQGANSMSNDSCGKLNVEFLSDNELFTFSLCQFYIGGILFGKNMMRLGNTITVEHPKSGLISAINLNNTGSFFSGWFNKKKRAPDAMEGFIAKKEDVNFDAKNKIYSIKEGKKAIGIISGEWCDFIKYDDKEIWNKNEDDGFISMEKMEFTLPSDSTYREDAMFLKIKKEALAEEAKTFLEERDKSDENLRKISNKQ
jgi:hypothetical protein